jgi:hypothetical protein
MRRWYKNQTKHKESTVGDWQSANSQAGSHKPAAPAQAGAVDVKDWDFEIKSQCDRGFRLINVTRILMSAH